MKDIWNISHFVELFEYRFNKTYKLIRKENFLLQKRATNYGSLRLYEFHITATDCCLMATHLQ